MNQRKAGALLSYVYLGLTCIIGLVYTPFALYYLGEGEYGVFSIALSVISFLTILDFGFNQTMIRYVSRYKALGDKEGEEHINGMFLILYSGIALIALVAGVILTIFIEDIFAGSTVGLTEWEAMRLKIIFAILLINLVGSFPMGVYTAILNANEGFVVLKGINILTVVLTYTGMTIALFCGGKAITMAVITTVVSLVLKLIQGIYVQRRYKPRFRLRGWDGKLFREVFVFSFFIFLNIVIDQLYANTDKVILGIVQSSAMVSIYAVGVQFTQYFEQFSTSISGVFLPRITELTTKNTEDMREVSEIFVRIGRIQFILLGFLMSGFIILGRLFIGLWVGDDMGDAYAIALVVIVPAIIPLSQNIGISVIRALNRHRFRSVMYLGIAVLNVGLSIPMAMKFGGFGAACVTGLGTCLGQILTMNWFYWKRIGLDIPGYWREVAKILAVMVPVGLLGWGMHCLPFWTSLTVWGGWLSFLLQVLLYSILFLVAAWAFIFNTYEKELVRGFLRVVLRLLLRFIPMRDDVMLESHPDFSGNTLVIYEELLKQNYHKNHRIIWCVYDEKNVPEQLPEGVSCVYKHKPGFRATWQRLKTTARCRYVIDSNSYIHKIRGNQVRLHLGHGMPIKLLPEYTNYDEIGDCDGYLTCGLYWKSVYTEEAHIPADKLLPIGYPRNDVLVKGRVFDGKPVHPMEGEKTKNREDDRRISITDEGREHGYFWHLPERERYILWMPTYRQHRNKASERQAEKEATQTAVEEGRWEVLAMEQLRKQKAPKMPYGMPEISDIKELEQLDELLEQLDLKIYFRPHPSQDLQYIAKVSPVNIRIADDEFLRRCEMSLYEVLRESEALITDYSSVYFDYLLTDKPIGLTLRDADTFFRDCICCFEDLREELAGFKIDSFDEVLEFVKLVNDGETSESKASEGEDPESGISENAYVKLKNELAEAKKWYHDVTDGSSTERVMAWLKEQGMPIE